MVEVVEQATVDAFARDGAVCLRGVFNDWVDALAAGVERNLEEPGEYFDDNTNADQTGRFWDDYCNWQRIPQFRQFAYESAVGPIAAALMKSTKVQAFHEHVLVKEPGTSTPTRWHSDNPYYFVDGVQNVSFWIPLDPVRENSLRLIKGSHLWDKDVLPVRWFSGDGFYPNVDGYAPVPDPDAEPDKFEVLRWDLDPGDAIAFHYRTVHGARGNTSSSRRRAFSFRVVGDDARYVSRPGPTSPPFPGHGMVDGDRLRSDWFPTLSLSR